ncbi:hypothetical protein HY637_02705 [Candidatus Woesearchaeota archaeon]|nr:hypothetical protein [Candidatus Pacearchaeota archaeon]MBI4452312.1 hypothetical protein [Candidatus Woesearchaeota archaeon]
MSIIVTAILVYLLIMFIVHEMFKKFFHMIIFIGLLLLAAALGYISLKGF